MTAHCAERKKKGCRAPRAATLRRTLARWLVRLCCRAAFSLSPVLSARSQLSPARTVNPRKGGVKVVIWRNSSVSAGKQRAAAGRGKARSQPPKSASCKPRKGAQNAAFTQFGLPSAPLFAPAGGRLSAAPVGAAPYTVGAPRCGGAGLPVPFRRKRQKAPVSWVTAHTQARAVCKCGETLSRFTRCALCSFGALSRVTINGCAALDKAGLHKACSLSALRRRGHHPPPASRRVQGSITFPRGLPVSLRHIVNYRHGVGGLGVFTQSPQQLLKALVFLCCAQH